MRRIRSYVFKAGSKLPLAGLPAVIHQFLDEQGLKSASYLYRFIGMEYPGRLNPCRRIYKDIPLIGEPVRVKGDRFDDLVITNMMGKPGVDEAAILPYMKKISRTY